MKQAAVLAIVWLSIGTVLHAQEVQQPSTAQPAEAVQDGSAPAEEQALPPLEPPKIDSTNATVKLVPVTPPPQAQPAPQVEAPQQPDDRHWRLALGLGLMLSSADGVFSNVTATDASGSASGTALLRYGKAISFAIEGTYMPRQSWGFAGGLNYEGEREFEGGSLSSGTTVITLGGSSNQSKIQLTTLYANAVYRWDVLYLPFGLNFTSVKFTPASGFTGTHSESGDIGVQLGVGGLVTEQFAIELLSRVNTFKLRAYSAGTTIDYGRGHFQSTGLAFKYAF